MALLTQRYANEIAGVISCFDRVVVTGSIPNAGYGAAMTGYLSARRIRIVDYPQFADGLRARLRDNAAGLAAEAGIEIQFIAKPSIRKEDVVGEVLAKRGNHPGLVAILSAMEGCTRYEHRYDKAKNWNYLRPTSGKCLHYYFYFVDPWLGLCHVRVPTWCPFRLQFYFNAHNWLANQLTAAGIGYRMLDNAFAEIDDFERAQALADSFDVRRLHRLLDEYARRFCPVIDQFPSGYHWTIMQAELATDIVFKRPEALAPLYQGLVRTTVQAVKAEDIASFLGRRLNQRSLAEIGSRFATRIEGTCIRHRHGPASIKLYDKFGCILRIETTCNDVSFFKHYRKVVHKDGSRGFKTAALKKSIHSFNDLRGLLQAANRRYIAFLSDLDDHTTGRKCLATLTTAKTDADRNYRGFNFFAAADERLLRSLVRGQFCISGLRHRDLASLLPDLSSGQLSRLLKRLRVLGVIKRVGRTYKHYITDLGRRAILACCKITEFVLVPTLARPATISTATPAKT